MCQGWGGGRKSLVILLFWLGWGAFLERGQTPEGAGRALTFVCSDEGCDPKGLHVMWVSSQDLSAQTIEDGSWVKTQIIRSEGHWGSGHMGHWQEKLCVQPSFECLNNRTVHLGSPRDLEHRGILSFTCLLHS